ncbi:hypothetical protein J2T08_006304 [Neorhizobium galegae]|nr:hypothetical protein [Neorhizobium galegae]MDQ0138359.1 hypothetical protein [Neorhizobium galegae]
MVKLFLGLLLVVTALWTIGLMWLAYFYLL